MYRRRFLSVSVGLSATTAGCMDDTGDGQEPAVIDLKPVFYNQTPDIETLEVRVADEEEVYLEGTYTLGPKESSTDQAITVLSDERYSISIDRHQGGKGMYTVVPDADYPILAIHILEDEVTLRQERKRGSINA